MQFSTLNGTFPDTFGIDSMNRLGISFITDNNTYALNSITLRVRSSNAPVTFTAELCLDYDSTQLELLGGNSTINIANKQTDLTFTSTGTTLLPNTRYGVLFSTDIHASVLYYGSWNGSGPWSLSTSYQSVDAAGTYSVNGGVNWYFFGPPLAYSVDASIVPEPSCAALIIAAGLALCRQTIFACRREIRG